MDTKKIAITKRIINNENDYENLIVVIREILIYEF